MTRKEYIHHLLSYGKIKYKCVGSECSMDCIVLSSRMFFGRKSIAIWMPKMAWDDNEALLSNYIDDIIENGQLKLTLDICLTTDAFEDTFAIYNQKEKNYYRDAFGDIPVFDEFKCAYDYLAKMTLEII